MLVPSWTVVLCCVSWFLTIFLLLQVYNDSEIKLNVPDVKEEIRVQESIVSNFVSLEDYNGMLKKLKIYVYDVKIGLEMKSQNDYKYGVEKLFIDLLLKSPFVTKNPSEATFFFIPTRCSAYRKSAHDRVEGGRIAAQTVQKIVDWIKTTYQYWNSSLGVDHVYVCSHDMGGECSQLADQNLHKNAIGLFNTADYADPLYIPHKDIALPPHPGHGTGSFAYKAKRRVLSGTDERSLLAFFAGNMQRGFVRQQVYSLYKNEPDFKLVSGYLSDEDYLTYLSSAKFCLFLRGNRVWSPRLMDCLWFESIPVIISDHYDLPLAGLVDWDDISVRLPESQIPNLKKILLTISAVRLKEMQSNILRVSTRLTWNDPAEPFDAFHLVLYQLWKRRHIVRKNNWKIT